MLISTETAAPFFFCKTVTQVFTTALGNVTRHLFWTSQVFGKNAVQADSSLSFETQLRCFKEDEGTTDSSLTFKVLDNKFLRSTGFAVREDSGPRRFGQSVSMMPDPSSQEHISRLEHDSAELHDSSAIFTSSPIKSSGSSNLNFFWMCCCWCELEELDVVRRNYKWLSETKIWINVFLLWSVIFSLLRRR